MSKFTIEVLNQGLSYTEYRKIIDDLLKQNKTTGSNHSEEYLEFTKLNVYRMNRIESKIKLTDLLAEKANNISSKFIWVLFSEAWCGDAAQNVPLLAKIKFVSPKIDLKILLRDEHPELIEKYLTDGSKSIPKLVCLNADTLEEVFTWGPRPASAQEMIMQNKFSASPLAKHEMHQKLHLWYAQDKCATLQQEIFDLIEKYMV